MRRLTLHVRRGCHLCEEMASLLDELAPELDFEVAQKAVDDDPQRVTQWPWKVPVLMLGERKICHHWLNLVA